MNKLNDADLLMLDNISIQTVKKRIKRELERFDDTCSLISIDNDYEDKNKSIITILDNTNNFVYSIIPSIYYPFRPPQVQINFRPYLQFLKINYLDFSVNLKKIYKINCLCCSTITCPDNWSPGFTISHIIQEARKFKDYKLTLIKKMMSDKIKLKYLIQDIDLDSWLF